MKTNEDWQPIETAPKDGRDLILANDCKIEICHWGFDDLWKREPKEWVYGECEGEYNVYQVFDDPTHWMPAPKLPE